MATNPKAFGVHDVTMDDAWRLYDLFLSDSRIGYSEELAGIEPHWRAYTAGLNFSPKVSNDSYLAAFAKAAGWQIATCDQGFIQYAGTSSLILA